MEHKGMKIMAKNRQVYHDYFVEEEYEAGIELFGTEVKSIRAGTSSSTKCMFLLMRRETSSTRTPAVPAAC